VLRLGVHDLVGWGPHRYVITPQAPGDVETVDASVRLHSVLGMTATRSGEWISVGGSTRAYHSVLDAYKPWNARPVAVQRWTGDGWVTVRTLQSDADGNVETSIRIPWHTGLRLTTQDTAKIWGASTEPQDL